MDSTALLILHNDYNYYIVVAVVVFVVVNNYTLLLIFHKAYAKNDWSTVCIKLEELLLQFHEIKIKPPIKMRKIPRFFKMNCYFLKLLRFFP